MTKAKVFSFSAKGNDAIWIEGYKNRLEGASFSKALIDGLKGMENQEQSRLDRELARIARRNDFDAVMAIDSYKRSLVMQLQASEIKQAVEDMTILERATYEANR